jgi:hypothetical protein
VTERSPSDESGDEESDSEDSGSRGSGGCGEDCDEDPGDEDPGDDDGEPAPVAPGAFGKTSPANGATGLTSSVSLSWSVSSNAASYQYCVDTTNDNVCRTPSPSSGWATTSSTSANVSGLQVGTTYYWQVYAYSAPYGTYADGGTWFSFTVS